MDKRAQKEKKEVVDERKGVRKDARADATQLTSFTQTDEFADLDDEQQKVVSAALALKERDAWCLYPTYVKWLKEMIEELRIPIVVAKEEADTVLARGSYDVVISSDSDLLILGVKILWIPHRSIQQEIHQKDFLNLLGLEGEQLYQLAFLCGCDVQPRKIVDIQTAVSLLRFYGSLQKINERLPTVSREDIDSYMRLRESVWLDTK
jgi:5'-3' exonuclease